MQLLRLDPSVHRVRDIPFTHYLRRNLDDSFLTYWHEHEQVWVVAVWVNRPRGLIREYAIIPNGGPTREFFRFIEGKARAAERDPITGRQLTRAAREAERARLRENMEYQEEYNDVKRFIGRNAAGVAGDSHCLR